MEPKKVETSWGGGAGLHRTDHTHANTNSSNDKKRTDAGRAKRNATRILIPPPCVIERHLTPQFWNGWPL